MRGKSIGWAAVAVAAVLAAVVAFRPAEAQQPAPVQPAAAASGPKYTVVDTEGTNLLVVDNSSNTLYFYTVDPGAEVGGDLHLRGSLDLNEVGKPTLKPRRAEKKGDN